MFKNVLHKTKKFIIGHKIIGGVLAVIIVGAGYLGYRAFTGDSASTRYVLAAASKGTIVVSVSGSGQVSASNEVSITPKVSGDVVYVGVENGAEVKAGSLIVQIDAGEAQKTVRDAEMSLESAELSLEKFRFENSEEKMKSDLTKTYDDGFNVVANAFLDLPVIKSGLTSVLFGSNFNTSQSNIDYYAGSASTYDEKASLYRDNAYEAYQAARAAYDANFENYKSETRFSEAGAIESLINETYNTTKFVAEAVKSATDLIQFYQDKSVEHNITPKSLSDTHITSLNTYTGQASNHLLSLFSVVQSIQDAKDAFVKADFDLRSQELSVKQRENSLLDAKEKLADYYVRAPFGGVITGLSVKKSDSVSSASTLGTLITKNKVAEISLNEVDVAQVKTGEKVTLAFDAVPDLTIAGEVAEVDAVGTVSQGVVTYIVKIVFNAQDERIKPAMSVSADIVTETKADILVVPNSAVKIQNNKSFVEVLVGDVASGVPRRQSVETGISNDEFTEIVSGLNEGDAVVVRTVQGSALPTSSVNQQNSNGGLPAFGGGVRILR
ncbi:MAG: efflux RND transporter periplasmic adaptor subunit [Candidatus Jorgensenbacteria bacterium]